MFVYFLDTGNELVINKRQSIEKMVGCLLVYVRVSLKVRHTLKLHYNTNKDRTLKNRFCEPVKKSL